MHVYNGAASPKHAAEAALKSSTSDQNTSFILRGEALWTTLALLEPRDSFLDFIL